MNTSQNVLKSLFTAKYLTELSQATHPDDCCFHTLCISLMPRVDGLSSPCTIAPSAAFLSSYWDDEKLCGQLENASLYHLILHYTFREQNTSQSRASWRTASLRDFISIHPSTPCESEAARTVPSTETVARDSVGISWTRGRPMDVKPIKWRLTGNSWAGSPTCKPSPHRSLSQGAFHRSSFPFNAVVPWCKIQLTRIQTNKLPSTLSPIYQQIIEVRHSPRKAHPRKGFCGTFSGSSDFKLSRRRFSRLHWRFQRRSHLESKSVSSKSSAPKMKFYSIQCFLLLQLFCIRKTMFVCALFMKHAIIALIPGATRIKIMVKWCEMCFMTFQVDTVWEMFRKVSMTALMILS